MCGLNDPDKYTYINSTLVELHLSCWKKCSGTDEIEKEYTSEEWLDLTGENYSEEYVYLEFSSGAKFWYKKGKLHRLDGPACIYADGARSFYIEDNYYYESEYWEAVNKTKAAGL